MKNKRVRNIISLIEKFKVSDATQVRRLFYTHYKTPKVAYIKACEKLKALTDEKTLYRKRNDINSKYFYSLEKGIKQAQHKWLLTELYVRLCELYGMHNIEVIPEYVLDGCRADAYIKIKHGNRLYLFYVEIHISNNPFNIEKYERLYNSSRDVFPYILVVTDKKLSLKTTLDVITVDCDFKDLRARMPIGKSVFITR